MHGQKAGPPRTLPPPNKVLEHDNAAASHPPTASSRSTGVGKNAADEQVGTFGPIKLHIFLEL